MWRDESCEKCCEKCCEKRSCEKRSCEKCKKEAAKSAKKKLRKDKLRNVEDGGRVDDRVNHRFMHWLAWHLQNDFTKVNWVALNSGVQNGEWNYWKRIWKELRKRINERKLMKIIERKWKSRRLMKIIERNENHSTKMKINKRRLMKINKRKWISMNEN